MVGSLRLGPVDGIDGCCRRQECGLGHRCPQTFRLGLEGRHLKPDLMCHVTRTGVGVGSTGRPRRADRSFHETPCGGDCLLWPL